MSVRWATVGPSTIVCAVVFACLLCRSSGFSLGIVNHKIFHVEVLAGVLQVLKPLANVTTVYMHAWSLPKKQFGFGFADLLDTKFNLRALPKSPDQCQRHDAVMFISPEFNLTLIQQYIEWMRPVRKIMFVHHSDNVTNLQLMTKLGTHVMFATLAPHVAHRIQHYLGPQAPPVLWMLPTVEFNPKRKCASTSTVRRSGRRLQDHQDMLQYATGGRPIDHRDFTESGHLTGQQHGHIQQEGQGRRLSAVPDLYNPQSACLDGFAIQGLIESARRNYTRVWDDLKEADKKVPRDDRRFHIHVLARNATAGENSTGHEDVAHRLTFHRSLPYPQFYEVIHHSYALLPCFAGDMYYGNRSSSSFATSLTTTTPLLATRRMLEVYTFLKPNMVFMEEEGETTVSAMLRIMNLPKEVIWRTRAALHDLQLRLNREAQGKLFRMIGADLRLIKADWRIRTRGSQKGRARNQT